MNFNCASGSNWNSKLEEREREMMEEDELSQQLKGWLLVSSPWATWNVVLVAQGYPWLEIGFGTLRLNIALILKFT